MGAMVTRAEIRATLESAHSLMTGPGKSHLEAIVLTSTPVQEAHAEAGADGSLMLVVVPVRLAPWLKVWAWHLAYPFADKLTSYEWGFTPSLSLTLRFGHRAAERRAAMMRHPSSRHAE